MTSFTFESSVSSQGPLPKEDPVGVCGAAVCVWEGVLGGEEGGMHWARGGRDIHTLTSSEAEKEPSLHQRSVCVWVCVLYGATFCEHSDQQMVALSP